MSHGLSTSPAAFSRAHLLAADSFAEAEGTSGRAKRRRLSNHLDPVDESAVSDDEEDEAARRSSRRISRRISTLSSASLRQKRREDEAQDERTPLLPQPPDEDVPLPDDQDSDWRFEAWTIIAYSTPILLATICEYSLVIATTVSVGHISTTALAAASLASLTINVTTLSIIQGLCTALDTLCSQAAGSKRPELAGLHAQRSCIVLGSVLPFQIALCWASEPILLAIGQDPDVSHLASAYLKIMSFGLPGYAIFEIMRRWLQAQGIMSPPTIAVAIFAPVNIFLQWLLVVGPLKMGFIGAPLSTVIAFNGMALLVALYCFFRAPRRCWAGFSRKAFDDLGPNLRLGLAGVLAVSSEWWAFEGLGLGASYLGPDKLAAQSVILSTSSLTYQVPWSLSVGASVRIGNLLGAERGKLAKRTLKVAIALGALIGLFNSALLVGLRSHIPRIFTNDDEIIELAARVFPLVALYQLSDAINGVCSGVLRGAGRSPLSAGINAIGYYLIGLPTAFILAFRTDLGLEGLWIGITVALSVCMFLFLYFTLRLDLEREVQRAKERMV